MRISTLSTFSRVMLGLRPGQLAGLRAQEQISTGRRILRPSDDPAGTARAVALRRSVSQSMRIQEGLSAGRTRLDQATTTLQHGSELLTRARELVLQSMSGILNADDRASIAAELEVIRTQLLDQANLQVDGNYVFGGTALGTAPWEEIESGGTTHVVYRGNGEEQRIQAGENALIAISAVGNEVFGRAVPGAVRLGGLTGVRSGLTADEGSGYGNLVLRHDSTDILGLADVGLALVAGGSHDSLLGANALVVDGVAGTLRLGNGPSVPIPPAGERADVVVRNEQGGELHLDFSGWTGADLIETANGRGSISLDGTSFTALTFTQTDLELANPTLGQVLHVDTRAVLRAGSELVTFGDTVNPFDLLQGIVDDLRNEQGLDSSALQARLSGRLETLDDVHDDLLLGLGVLGARSARLSGAAERQGDLALEFQGRLADIEEVDLAEAALDLSRAQLILQVAQAAGARVIQTSLLNFLG